MVVVCVFEIVYTDCNIMDILSEALLLCNKDHDFIKNFIIQNTHDDVDIQEHLVGQYLEALINWQERGNNLPLGAFVIAGLFNWYDVLPVIEHPRIRPDLYDLVTDNLRRYILGEKKYGATDIALLTLLEKSSDLLDEACLKWEKYHAENNPKLESILWQRFL